MNGERDRTQRDFRHDEFRRTNIIINCIIEVSYVLTIANFQIGYHKQVTGDS